MTATPDPLPVTEPEVTSSFLSHNDETTTIRTISPKSSVTQGGGTTENQPNNGDVRYMFRLIIHPLTKFWSYIEISHIVCWSCSTVCNYESFILLTFSPDPLDKFESLPNT